MQRKWHGPISKLQFKKEFEIGSMFAKLQQLLVETLQPLACNQLMEKSQRQPSVRSKTLNIRYKSTLNF